MRIFRILLCLASFAFTRIAYCDPIRAIIWDFDGTLVDSMPSVVEAYNDGIFHSIGRRVSKEELAKHWHHNELEIFKSIIKLSVSDEQEIKKKSEQSLRVFIKKIGENSAPVKSFPGMSQFLSHLKKKGYLLAIFTGRDRLTTHAILRHLKLEEFFSVIITAEDLAGHRKPDPYGITKTIEGLNKTFPKAAIHSKNVLMLGDTPMDIAAAKNAGIKAVGCLWNHMPFTSLMTAAVPDLLIKEPNELFEYLTILEKN
jgi:phosphoglycolate phosphatase-like HAD superfamily hydrolase